MTVLTAERQRPFQMRPIENPFRRVVPAVVQMRDRVAAGVQNMGYSLAQRMQRSQAQDVSRLAQARATIAQAVDATRTHVTRDNARMAVQIGTQAAREATHYVATHKMEIAKKVAPSLAISITAKVAGAALAAPVIVAGAVAGGANEARRNIGTLNDTKADGIFATSAVLRRGFEKNAESVRVVSADAIDVSSSESTPLLQRIAQSKFGRGMRAYMHAEKSAASYVASHNAHIDRVMDFAPDAAGRAQAITDVDYLNKLRMDAAMARMTATSDVERAAARTVHQAVRERMRALELEAGPDSAIPYINGVAQRQILRAQRSVQFGKSYRNIVMGSIAASSGVRALKSALTSAGIFLGLSAVGVDAASPLRSLKDTMWGNVSDGIGRLAHSAGNGAQDLITHVLTATTPAAEAADLPVHGVQEVVRDSAPSGAPLPPVSSIKAALGPEAWTAQAHSAGDVTLNNIDPRLTTTVRVENGETIIEGKGVLSSGSPKAVDPSYAAAPRDPSFVRAPVADRVAIAAEVNAPIPMREVARTVQETQEYTIDGKVSWTQDIFDRKLLSDMQDAAHSMDWYGAPGTAERMVKEVFAVNPDLMDVDDMQHMQEYLSEHPDASFVEMWKELQFSVFADDMDKLTDGTAYKVLSEHTVVVQDPIAEINEEDAIVMGARRATKPPGLAKYVLSTDQQTAPPTSLQSSGTNTSGYQVVRPPQSTGVPSGANTIQGTYQQVAPPGGNTAASGTVNGFQQVRKPGEIISNNGTTGGQAVVSTQNSIVPPPHQIGSPDTGSAASNTLHDYQQVAPPGSNSAISNSSAVGTYQEVGQPSAPRPIEVARPANESFQIVSPPKPQEELSFQVVSLPRAVLPYEVSRDTQLASIVGPFDLSSGNSHVAYLESTNSYFPSSSSMPISMLNDRAPAIGAGAYEFNALGGTNIWTHTSSFKEGGKQWLEDARVYMQGGNGQPRLGPVQQLHRAQELLQSAPHLFINIDDQHQGGFSLTGVNHLLLNSDGSLDLSSTDGIIGGGPDTLSFIGCSYGHVQAIQMIIDHSAEAPTHLNQWFDILNNPYATGASVENAVDQIVKQWFSGTAYYSDFYNLYGYLLEEIPTPGTSEYTEFLNNLADNGYMSSGRLEFEFTIGGQ